MSHSTVTTQSSSRDKESASKREQSVNKSRLGRSGLVIDGGEVGAGLPLYAVEFTEIRYINFKKNNGQNICDI